MSGFSADWLALREPVDHRSRNAQVCAAMLAHLGALAQPRLIDLGCGSGSNLRALAPLLPQRQSWRLVDADPLLLAAAHEALQDWAQSSRNEGDVLHLTYADKEIEVRFDQVDLSRDLERVLDQGADLITAAAFFDLVAPDWLNRFCAALIARKLPFYTVLTYDGVEQWSPPHSADAQVLAAFHAHQASDKGFGPAAGPRATALMEAQFKSAGWHVMTGDSAWKMTAAQDAKLISALAQGAAQAVAETGRVALADLQSWLQARTQAERASIGHLDLFARP